MNIVTKPIKSADENICGAEFSVVSNGSGMDYGTASQKLTFNAFAGGDYGSIASGLFVFASDTANATIQLDYELAAQFSVREFKQAIIKKPDPESGESSSEILYKDNVNVSVAVIRGGEVLFSKGYNLKEEGEDGSWVDTSETGIYSGGGFSISMPAAMGAPYVAELHRLDMHSAAIRISASTASITASVKLLFPLEDKSGGFTTREQEAIDKSLKVFEGNTEFLYLDSEGKVTVGVGFMLPDESSALAYPFLDFDDNPASDEQKRAEWRTVHALATGHLAGWYEDSTNLYLSDDFIESHLQSLVAESFNELTRIYPDFGKYPSAARVALQDMIYNLGMTKLNENFPNLKAAVNRQDWVTAAAESHRKGPNEDRNNAVRDLFLKAAGAGL